MLILRLRAARVEALKAEHPEASLAELSQYLIRDKCRRTGAVGAVTTGAGLIPGIGTAVALTLGVAADIGATFKMQSELVLELAALYDHTLTDEEKQRVVMVITGISAGSTVLARGAGRSIAVRATEMFAGRAFLKAIPVLGVVAMAGTNVLSTYVIGQRADAYFRLGPEAVGSWSDSLRTVSGVDERRIGEWLAESSKATSTALISGAGKVGRAAGKGVSTGTSKMASGVGTGAKKAGHVAQTGVVAYFSTAAKVWSSIFRFVGLSKAGSD